LAKEPYKRDDILQKRPMILRNPLPCARTQDRGRERGKEKGKKRERERKSVWKREIEERV